MAHESLKDRSRRWVAAMKSAATGPLIIAQEVVAVVDAWPRYQAEAGLDVTADAWLRSTFARGQGVRFWRSRSEAVRVLGEAIRRSMHHDAAVLVAGKVARHPEMTKAIMGAIYSESRKDGHPVNKDLAARLWREVMGPNAEPRAKSCATCAKLRARIAELEAAQK